MIFFWFHKEDTAKEMGKFLFELQGLYFKQYQVEMSPELKEQSILKFSMLYDLITDIKPVLKTD